MIFNKPLDSIFGSKAKINILRHLTLYKKEAATRELAREVGIAPPNILKLLKELENEDILISKKYGNSIIYALNTGNILVKKIIVPSFKLENGLYEELGLFLASNLKMPVVSIILFGSRARKEEKSGSDIDLMFIIRAGEEARIENKLLDLNPAISSGFGSSLSPVIYSQEKFIRKAKTGNKLVKNIIKDGQVLYGKFLSDILYENKN